MYYTNKQDVIDWFERNTEYSKEELSFLLFIKKDNGELIVNSNKSIVLFDITEQLPFKFGSINGNFEISDSSFKNFKGFPEFINGKLECPNCCFENSEGWNIKEIKGHINLCSQNTKLNDLNFLIDTQFKEILLQLTNTPFINDEIPEIYSVFSKNTISHKEYLIAINEFKSKNEEIDNYLIDFEIKDINVFK